MQFCRKCLLYLRQKRYRIMILKAELLILVKIKKTNRARYYLQIISYALATSQNTLI